MSTKWKNKVLHHLTHWLNKLWIHGFMNSIPSMNSLYLWILFSCFTVIFFLHTFFYFMFIFHVLKSWINSWEHCYLYMYIVILSARVLHMSYLFTTSCYGIFVFAPISYQFLFLQESTFYFQLQLPIMEFFVREMPD